MIIDKIIRSLLTISISLTSFSTFSGAISLGSVKGVKAMADTTFIPVNIDGYQQYKEIKLKINITNTANNGFNVGEYGEGVYWIDCKNKLSILRFTLIFNPDGSLQEERIQSANTKPESFLEKNERNSFLNNLCQNSLALIPHPSLIRSLKNIDEYKYIALKKEKNISVKSQKEYKQNIRDIDNKMAKISSHRSRLHSGRDPENPDILTKVTKENTLAVIKKDFELTCEKLKLLNQQKKFIFDQDFYTKDFDLVPVFETLRNERIRAREMSEAIKTKGGKADICLDM